MSQNSKNGHRPESSDHQKKVLGFQPSADRPPLSFDIRAHVDKLKPAKEKGRYHCPVCDDDNFTFSELNGKFSCWSTGCKPKAIMDALAPLEKRPWSSQPQRRRPKSRREQDKAIVENSVHVETQVDHLCTVIKAGSETFEEAQVTLAAFCKEHGHDKFTATQLLKVRAKERGLTGDTSSDEAPRLLREYRLIEQHLGNRLRFNTLFSQIELDGDRLQLATAKLDLTVNHGLSLKSGREDVEDIIVKVAKANSYSPVVEYLEQVVEQHGGDTAILADLSQRYFGTDDPVYDLMVRRFLIAAVARAYSPGCKHDCALILEGPQEARKSTWLKTLASEPWFDDSMGAASEKDEKMKLHRRWIVEWAELETVFKRKDVSQTKAFLSSSTDFLRPPYGRELQDMPRPSVIAGTTNEKEFLVDSTGSRRFWVVPVKQTIDAKLLETERDRIWAAAVTAYLSGERWWWETAQDGDINALNAPYQTHDPWEEIIADQVEGMSGFTTKWVLNVVLGMDADRQLKKHSNRVAGILREIGFEETNPRRLSNGKRQRVWEPKGS